MLSLFDHIIIKTLIWATVLSFCSCQPNVIIKEDTVTYTKQVMDSTITEDSAVANIAQKHRIIIEEFLDEVLCQSDANLRAGRPDNELNRFLADAILYEGTIFAQKNGLPTPELSLVNVGGIRSRIPQGEVRVRNAYEITPFENYAVMVELDSASLKTVLDHVAYRGGEAMSGLTFTIQDRKATEILVNGQPLSANKKYHMVTMDYIADGGDSFKGFTGCGRHDFGVLFRDLLIDHLRRIGKNGEHIKPTQGNRIKNVDLVKQEAETRVEWTAK